MFTSCISELAYWSYKLTTLSTGKLLVTVTMVKKKHVSFIELTHLHDTCEYYQTEFGIVESGIICEKE